MPWFPPLTAGEILRPVASEIPMPSFQHAAQVPPGVTIPPATVTYAAPATHDIPEDNEPIYHSRDMGPTIGWMSYEKNMMKCSEK